jgi:hypothetical protein
MANEMRDRLVEVLNETFDAQYTKSVIITAEHTADHLIADGWIRLPCKVGNTVYYIHETNWDENYKDYIKSEKFKQGVLQVVYSPKLKTNLMLEVKEFDWDLFNNWLKGEIFLTKSEAEQKLKEMRGEQE